MADADPISKSFARRAGVYRPKTLAESEARSRAITVGAGISSPLLTATEAQLARALVDMDVAMFPALKVERQDRFYALNGVRRGDDHRGDL